MNKCNNCFHRKICIDSANFNNAENCRQYVSEKDVQEVKHGRWEVSNTEFGYNNAEIPIEWECSLCSSAFEDEYLYCPHCGCRMDGDNNA